MPRRNALYTTSPLTFQDSGSAGPSAHRRTISNVPLKATATTGLSSVNASHRPSASVSSLNSFLPTLDPALFTSPVHNKVAELRGSFAQPSAHLIPSGVASGSATAPFSNPDFGGTASTSQFFAELFGVPMWNQPVGWDTLLSFDAAAAVAQQLPSSALPAGPASAPSPAMSHTMMRVRSDESSDSYPLNRAGLPLIPEAGPSKLAHMGSEMVWKTILASQVEVEGVGQVPVCKVLQEVWQRGGGDIVRPLSPSPK